MASPTVRSRTTWSSSSASTSHSVTLPATVSAGDLLVVAFVAGVTTITFPGGWTASITQIVNTTLKRGVWTKTASGSEGGTTITVTVDASSNAAALSWSIQNGGALEGSTWGTTGTSTTPNPPSLTTSWAAEDNLWLAVYAAVGTVTTTTYPSTPNYINGQTVSSTSGSTDFTVGGGERTVTATATENPNTFTISASVFHADGTLVIRYSAPASGFSVTSVTPATFDDGRTGVIIAGTGFGASQGSSTVTIGGQAQTVTAWSATSITITAVRGSNSMGLNSLKVTVV